MKLLGDIEYTCLPIDRFRLFSDIGGFDPDRISVEKRAALLKNADAAWNVPLTLLTACDYRRFSVNGNRYEYENIYFSRRTALLELSLGHRICGNNRYLDKLMDFAWAVCEETSWVIPAHNVSADDRLLDKPLPDAFDNDIPYIDLFSADTAAVLALAYTVMKNTEDGLGSVKIIRQRIAYEINRRIIVPFLSRDMRWITEFIDGRAPWIVGNILTAAALTVTDDRRGQAVEKALRCLDLFIDSYEEDGGCNEGTGFWSQSCACLFDALELLWDMTGGKIDIFRHPFITAMGEYIGQMHIAKNYYVTFADSHAQMTPDYAQIARFGRRCASKRLEDFGRWGMQRAPHGEINEKAHHCYRYVKNLYEEADMLQTVKCPDFGSCVLKGRQLAVLRDTDTFVAIKGGSNNEKHNHNDVGNFIMYSSGRPVFIDVGVGTYRRDTFSDKRYTIWTMRSDYHNVAEIDGVLQQNGQQYRTDGFICENSRVTVAMRSAYPGRAGLVEYTRMLELENNTVTLTERLRSCEKRSVTFNFITPDAATIEGNTVKLSGGVTISCNRAANIAVEPIELTDMRLANDWNADILYRLRFTIVSDNILAIFTITKS